MRKQAPLFLTFVVFAALVISVASCVNDNLESLAPKKSTDSTTSSSSSATTTTTTTTPVTTTPVTTTPITTTPTTGTTTPVVTSTVSFAKDIKPILNKYQCASCHGSAYASYSGASSLGKSGQLYGTMSWSNGYKKMPPGQRATTAELALISTWIKDGTLNN